jgi:hypothetical protein
MFWPWGRRALMANRIQFSLWYLLRQLMWIAVILGAFRLLPSWPPPVGLHQLERFLFVRCVVLSCIGFAAGAMIGGLQQRTVRGGMIGLGVTVVATGLWNIYVWVQIVNSL